MGHVNDRGGHAGPGWTGGKVVPFESPNQNAYDLDLGLPGLLDVHASPVHTGTFQREGC